MAATAVRRVAGSRLDIEAWIEQKLGNAQLAALIGAVERLIPDAPYDQVLVETRDRITGNYNQGPTPVEGGSDGCSSEGRKVVDEPVWMTRSCPE